MTEYQRILRSLAVFDLENVEFKHKKKKKINKLQYFNLICETRSTNAGTDEDLIAPVRKFTAWAREW